MSGRVTESSERLFVVNPAPELLSKRLTSGKYQLHEDGLYRRCSKCLDYWPADSEFFYTTKRGDGLNDWCKACYQEWRWPNGRPSLKQVNEVRA